MIKLISTDMDGTLLNDNEQLPEDFFFILDELTKRGIKFAVASGRSYCTLYKNFKQRTHDIIYIADNGTCIVENNKTKHSEILSTENVNQIVETCANIEGLHIILCGKKGAHILETPWFVEEIDKYYDDRITEKSLLNVEDEIYKIGIYDQKGALTNSFPILNPIFSKTLNVVCSATYWADIMKKGASKGHALFKIQKDYGISPDETMAFGDFYNDVEMLQQARYSFVMQNAMDDMKKFGNFIAKSNNECGVTTAITELVLKNKISNMNLPNNSKFY